MKKIDRTNEINTSNEGCLMKIVEYNSNRDIVVEFQDNYKVKIHTDYKTFKEGCVKNPYYKSVYGVGYIGEGKYKVRNNSKPTNIYNTWIHMLRRCYDPYELNKNMTYINCIVCDEWLCFQNFAEWYENNYYEVNDDRMELDKDILHKGNKIYSHSTCIFVPERINSLFIKCDAIRGRYPIGVHWNKKASKFYVKCRMLEDGKKKRIHLGSFNTELEAFNAYKKFKESYIKQVADEYKELIPQKLYNAMCNWEVEMDD